MLVVEMRLATVFAPAAVFYPQCLESAMMELESLGTVAWEYVGIVAVVLELVGLVQRASMASGLSAFAYIFWDSRSS
jgi:hypothetical protein